MANHVRQQIREALATLLTGLTTTGSRVYQSRVKVLADNELPGLIVLTNSEDVQTLTFSQPAVMDRVIQVEVIGRAKLSSNLDDTLDTIAKEVEQAVYATTTANTLGGLVKDLALTSIAVEINTDYERPVGQITMQFNANYNTQASAPTTSI